MEGFQGLSLQRLTGKNCPCPRPGRDTPGRGQLPAMGHTLIRIRTMLSKRFMAHDLGNIARNVKHKPRGAVLRKRH